MGAIRSAKAMQWSQYSLLGKKAIATGIKMKGPESR
jgi:hypothetical protein